MPLPLYGSARTIGVAPRTEERQVLRLQMPSLGPQALDDVALVRNRNDAELAAPQFDRLWVVSDQEVDFLPPNVIAHHVPSQFDYLAGGDIIGLDPRSGKFRVHYRHASKHNSFLVTERCNHYCLMCSQPPKDVDDRWILDEIKRCLPLIDRSTHSLGFTGGEPLLDWERFIATLAMCRDVLPETSIHVLSNGRAFASTEIVTAWANLGHPQLTVGIPIYAAVDHVHDYVVQARGAFDQTLLGILKLKDRGGRVEVRVVMHAVTAPRLAETCKWIARNLPFVDHVALMGLENTGFAIANDHLLWIDPMDYQRELESSVVALDAAGVNVSIYNLPLCVVPPSVRRFAARSISDWKNGFAKECGQCCERADCCGFFTSGRPKFSRGIRAIHGHGAASSVLSDCHPLPLTRPQLY